MTAIDELKIRLQEDTCPFFSEDKLSYYYEKNNQNLDDTTYECLQVKAEDTTLSLSGLTCADTSRYFRRLAQKYCPNHSGVL